MGRLSRTQAVRVLCGRQEWLTQKIAAHPDNSRANSYLSEEIEALALAIVALDREREIAMLARAERQPPIEGAA